MPDFQKRHYEFVANVLRKSIEKHGYQSEAAVLIADEFATHFKADNFNFKTDTFLKACGLEG